MTEANNTIYFESDEEFADFCLAPYAVLIETKSGSPTYTGVYSDEYKKCIEQGKTFIIKNEDSQVFKRKGVEKRVPLRIEGFPSYNRKVLVSLPVKNLEQYFDFEM